MDEHVWLARVEAGDFSAIPPDLNWDNAFILSQAIGNMYRHWKTLGLPKPEVLYKDRLFEAKQTGAWQGTALELWVCLWYSGRLAMIGLGEPKAEDRQHLDQLCAQLRAKLQSIDPAEKAVFRALQRTVWSTEPLCLPRSDEPV